MTQDATTNWNFNPENGTYGVMPTDAVPKLKLPAGAYSLHMGMGGPYAEAVELKKEQLIAFEDGPTHTILGEINKFWSIKDRYDRLGIPYRRGILMHGIPGTGKSGIVRMICDNIIANDGLVLMVKRAGRFTEWLPTLNRMEPVRNIVAVLEDVDGIYHYDEQEFLQMMDGIGNYRPGMLFLATTNFLNQIPERIYRPSRFDCLVEVGAPDAGIRRQYVESLCVRYGIPVREDIIEASEGLSFAHLKEVLVSCLLYEKPVKEMVERMRKHAPDEDDGDDFDDDDE